MSFCLFVAAYHSQLNITKIPQPQINCIRYDATAVLINLPQEFFHELLRKNVCECVCVTVKTHARDYYGQITVGSKVK